MEEVTSISFQKRRDQPMSSCVWWWHRLDVSSILVSSPFFYWSPPILIYLSWQRRIFGGDHKRDETKESRTTAAIFLSLGAAVIKSSILCHLLSLHFPLPFSFSLSLRKRKIRWSERRDQEPFLYPLLRSTNLSSRLLTFQEVIG